MFVEPTDFSKVNVGYIRKDVGVVRGPRSDFPRYLDALITYKKLYLGPLFTPTSLRIYPICPRTAALFSVYLL